MQRIKIVCLLISIALVFTCCKDSDDFRIPEDKLLVVLVDAHLAEALLQNAHADERDSLSNIYYSQIFKIHQIDETDFSHDLRLLSNDPTLTRNFYEKVLESMSLLEVEPDKDGNQDSIRTDIQ